MELQFWLISIVKTVVLPPGSLLLLAVAGLVVMGRRPVLGRRLVGTGLVLLYLLATPLVASLLQTLIAHDRPFEPADAVGAQAIVILGGGLKRASEYGGETISVLTLERTRYGAFVARATGLPVLVSGGRRPEFVQSEAELMRTVLTNEFGIPVRWTESRSRNTRENAQRSAELLQTAGVTRVVLVVHAFDVRRARAEFEAAGLAVIPAATAFPRLDVQDVLDFLPSLSALQGSYYATYEMLGLAVRTFR